MGPRARLAGARGPRWLGRGAPSGPALTQQWKKLNDRAMPRLLGAFLACFEPVPYLGGYRLLAADGTEWRLLPGTGGDACGVGSGRGAGTTGRCTPPAPTTRSGAPSRARCARGGAEEDEPGALCELVDRLLCGRGLVPLWVADRNFCCRDVIAHMLDAGPAHPRATDRAAAFAAMLRSLVRRASHDVEAFAARLSHSVRPGRSHPRRKRPKPPPRSCCGH